MSGWVTALLVVATVSPAIVVLRLPGIGWAKLVAGMAAAGVVGTLLVAVADPLAELAEVEPESVRIAAGLVLGVTGLARLAIPVGRREEVFSGAAAWLVPVAYPVVVGPELVLALLAAGVGGQAWAGSIGLAVGLGLAAIATLAGDTAVPAPIWRATARLTAAVQVLVAIALTVDAIRAV